MAVSVLVPKKEKIRPIRCEGITRTFKLNLRLKTLLHEDGESHSAILTFKSNKKITLKEFQNEVEQWETHCHHSYDCCGQWYRSIYDAKKIGPRLFTVQVSDSLNV